MMQRAFDIDLNIDEEFGYWMAGFSDGESCFVAHLTNKPSGRALLLAFTIGLRADDVAVLEYIADTLKVGSISRHKSQPNRNPMADYIVRRTGDLYHVIIPLFERFRLRSKKSEDFETWSELVRLKFQSEGKRLRRKGGLPTSFWEETEALIKRLRAQRKFKDELSTCFHNLSTY